MRDFLSRFAPPSGAMRGFLSRLVRPSVAIHVDPAARYQTVEGWGTSLAWWGHVIGGWRDPARSTLADLIFSPTAGLGLNVVRYNVGGGDDPTHHHMRPGGDVPGYQPSLGVWDWSADANQRWMLQAAFARGANIVEAFSNSPPYWMTRSGCAAGAEDGGDNLRADQVATFAAYLAEVAAHFRDDWGILFRTVEPFNEPAASNWRVGNRQEGCHFSLDLQQPVIARLRAELDARGLIETQVAAADDYSVDQSVATVGAYGADTLAAIAQVNTHSYSGTRLADLRDLVASRGKRLWMSEYGTGGGAHDHAAMSPALTLAARITRDTTDLRPAAWVYWQAIEDEGGHNNWGFIHADFSGASESYWLTKQYFAMAQYCRFIRPGYEIIGTDDVRTLAALDPAAGALAVVCYNDGADDAPVRLDLSSFTRVGPSAAAHRTSPGEDLAPLPEIALQGRTLMASLPAQSITTFVVMGVAAG